MEACTEEAVAELVEEAAVLVVEVAAETEVNKEV
jgi:hypothetical protein